MTRARLPRVVSVVRSQAGYVRVEATDGRTYFALRDRAHRARTWNTVFGWWPTGSREIDKPATARDLPKAVRACFRATLTPAPGEKP